jgi:hypothetical protein
MELIDIFQLPQDHGVFTWVDNGNQRFVNLEWNGKILCIWHVIEIFDINIKTIGYDLDKEWKNEHLSVPWIITIDEKTSHALIDSLSNLLGKVYHRISRCECKHGYLNENYNISEIYCSNVQEPSDINHNISWNIDIYGCLCSLYGVKVTDVLCMIVALEGWL